MASCRCVVEAEVAMTLILSVAVVVEEEATTSTRGAT